MRCGCVTLSIRFVCLLLLIGIFLIGKVIILCLLESFFLFRLPLFNSLFLHIWRHLVLLDCYSFCVFFSDFPLFISVSLYHLNFTHCYTLIVYGGIANFTVRHHMTNPLFRKLIKSVICPGP